MKIDEAPGLEPFRVEPLEPTEPGVEEFKGWLPTGSDPGVTGEDTGRVNLEALRRIIRSLVESAVVHRSTSPGKKYIGRAFKGRSDAERERTMRSSMRTSINTPYDDKEQQDKAVQKRRDQIAKKKRKAESTALTSEKKKKKRKKKCDDLHGKCPGHWYAGGISTTPMIGEGDDESSS